MVASTHIIVVNYNAGDWLQRSLKSALDHSEGPITVVDNASDDGSFEYARDIYTDPRIHWHQNQQNVGFAAANNPILAALIEDFAVLMNPDCELQPSTLKALLLAFGRHPRLGMASCLIKDSEGGIQASCKRRFPTPWSALVRLLQLHRWQPYNPRFANFDYGDQPSSADFEFVEAVSGAFMVVRREALAEVGLLDEGYFMHCEDLDWCKRFTLAGWQVGFVATTQVIHQKGISSQSRPIGVIWNLHRGMLRFFNKFYFDNTRWPMRVLVKLGIMTSFLMRATGQLLTGRQR